MLKLLFSSIPLLGPISEFFAKILEFFNGLTGSFGWNVIMLTVAFRIVVLPLSFKQTKSMIAMQRLQPQLKEIQKKYKDDREKMGQEMMKLYKDNKVSPLGGCLPLILQLPILFALFEVLRNAQQYVHYKTSFSFMGISNLIATGQQLWSGGTVKMYSVALKKVAPVKVAGGEYIAVVALILLTIITGYISSKMMTNDPKQAKMMALMPVVFGVFAWILPAGVTVYIITTNVLMVIQQYVQLEAEGFYDEKRAQRLKTGEPFKWYERWRYKGYDYGSIVLTAVRIKNPAKLEEKRAAGKTGKTAVAGKGKEAPSKAKKETSPGKKPEGKKAAAKPSGKKPSGKPSGKKPAGKTQGSGQQQKTGKPKEKRQEHEPARASEDTREGNKPGSTETGKTSARPEKKISRPDADEKKNGAVASKPPSRDGRMKQYPAKKKGSRKK